MTIAPLLISKSNARSLWQEYRIYPDRLEFDTLLGMLTIDFDHIEDFKLAESDLKGLIRGDLQLKGFKPALKLDWANFVKHIVLDTQTGHIKRLLFTPEDPELFKDTLEAALHRHRA